ncbi:MAG: CUAEP/CCAEP-tail radical SAM (seleno)protein [Acidimicrobiales bacterium]
MRIVLVSTYELGHQPWHLASPAASLEAAGHEVRPVDLAIQSFDELPLSWAEGIAFSVPMHTAMRLSVAAASKVRSEAPGLPICFYGLYALAGGDLRSRGIADRLVAGEYEAALVGWANELGAGAGVGAGAPQAEPSRAEEPGAGSSPAPGATGGRGRASTPMGRLHYLKPSREHLAPLARYAQLLHAGGAANVGYVEATHGCRHRCRHCPVPVIYDGRIRLVGGDEVLADIEQLVKLGAGHVTFGDPDFLNAPKHSIEVVSGMHERFPALTFDCTVKVEHILKHREVWPEWAASGCLFVVSAFESVDDRLLARLDKGHCRRDIVGATALLRSLGIEVRPSFLPFTPWTSVEDVAELLRFIQEFDLVDNVDPVQLTIRLLVPSGSLLLADPELLGHLGAYDEEQLGYPWSSEDPRVDELQRDFAAVAWRAGQIGEPPAATFAAMQRVVEGYMGRDKGRPAGTIAERPGRHQLVSRRVVQEPPRLSEPWFCCSEPDESQLASLGPRKLPAS